VLEALTKCGACDSLGQTRATLFAQIERALARAASVVADRQRGQSSLFGALEETAARVSDFSVTLPEWPQHELLAYEERIARLLCHRPSVDALRSGVAKIHPRDTAALAELPNRSLTRIGGLIAAVQNGVSKKSGKPYAMVTLEDLEGSVQVLCMNENYDKNRDPADARQGHPCGWRGQHRRRAAEDLSAGNPAPGRGAAALHQTGALEAAHGPS